MRTLNIYDTRGNEVEISEDQLARHFKKSLVLLWSELGCDVLRLAAYDGDLYRIVGEMIAVIRNKQSALEHAEKRLGKARDEFAKLRDKQIADYDTMMHFIRRQMGVQDPVDADNVVELRRKAA